MLAAHRRSHERLSGRVRKGAVTFLRNHRRNIFAQGNWREEVLMLFVAQFPFGVEPHDNHFQPLTKRIDPVGAFGCDSPRAGTISRTSHASAYVL